MPEPAENYQRFDLDKWLDWLSSRHSDEIQLGLTRVQQVYRQLKLPKPANNVITVAGTNGKGSIVALLEAIYVQAGYRVGAYTSPHLHCFNERIRINEQSISDKELCDLFAWIERSRSPNYLTYFEVVTLASLAYFSEQQLDVAILEVGLGGRLDAVNIIDTDCAVITTIDYDHQHFLGNTIEEIAAEKAGIIRKGKPTIYGDRQLPRAIQTKAEKEESPLYQLGKQFDYQVEGEQIHSQIDANSYKVFSHIHPQACTVAMMAVTLMQQKLPVLEMDLLSAIKNCCLPGRLQWLQGKPMWLLDVAHNMQSIRRLYDVICKKNVSGNIRFVFGVFKDKPYPQIIELMAKLSQYWYISPLNNSRTASTLELMSEISHYKGNCLVFESIEQACEQAADDAEDNDLIVVFGSFITVQMAKSFLDKVGKN